MDRIIEQDILNHKADRAVDGSLRKLWSFSLFVFLVCHIAFSSQNYLLILNTYALYFFLGVSFLCIFVSGEIKFNLFLATMVVFQLVLLIGDIYSTSPEMMHYTYSYFVSMCIVFCMVNYIREDKDIKFIFKGIMVGGFALNIYIISLYGSAFIDVIMSQTRVGEVAGNANDIGIKSCISAFFALYFLVKEKQKKLVKIMHIVICFVCFFFALITASKQVVILLVVGLFYLFMIHDNKNPLVYIRNASVFLILLIVAVLLIYNVKYFEYLKTRIDEFVALLLHGGGSESDAKRMRFLSEGISVFLQKPIFGDGTAASYNYFSTYSHSNLVEILMNHGFLGFIVYYFPYPLAVYRCIQKKKSKYDTMKLSTLCLFVFISLIVLSFTLVHYNIIYYQLLIAVSATFGFKSKDDDSVVS